MYAGLAISLFLHAGLIAWAVLEFRATPALPAPAAPTIEAELITISEFTRLKQGDPKAKQLEAKLTQEPIPQVSEKEAPKPRPETTPPPAAAAPPPQPPKPEPPKPEPEKAEVKPPEPEPPKPDPIAEKIAALPPTPSPEELALKAAEEQKAKEEAEKKAREEAEKKKKEEAEKKRKEAEKKKQDEERKKKLAEAKKKAEEKKKFDLDKIAALIDKTPEKRGSPKSGTKADTDYTGPAAGEREGSGNELTARESDLLKGQIAGRLSGCWRLPGGGGGVESVIVTVRWRLTKTGELDGPPQVVEPRNDPVFQAAARAAVAAVSECAPFRLPPDRYEFWKTITWDFDPRHM
ncbi:MAG: protein TolA [Hyphomicrobiaceae bacterium]|nr:protein TolA [Hyphomicrobiaceae bacterium]